MIIGIDGNEANIENRVGVNQYAAELLCALERLPEAQKHMWIVYLTGPPLSHLPKERDGWKYKVLPGGGFWVLRKLTPHLWLDKPRPDVFFAPSHYAPPFLPMPLVVSIMDLGYLEFPEQFRKYDFYQLKYWGAWSVRIAKRVIAISEATKRDITKHYPWAKGKVDVTYLGYDKNKFKAQKSKVKIEEVRRKYGISGDYILYLGTLKPSKNIEGLVDAFALVTHHLSPVTLVIVGKKGWLYDSIFEKVRELGLERKVLFTDFVGEKDKLALISGSKVLVSPSFWEGFGLHALEAMACGVPVVVSNIGSFPEVVGDVGILVDPADSGDIAKGIEKVVSASRSQYDEMVKKSVVQAKKFSWEKTARQTIETLEAASV
ncbi:MAG: glycosyltransferase family 4 protein [Candidatus Blackburnbacteria bacterium]|nr:glycosyltransferase family 4 protein [Candidatus Blackburnbacteria bacterium]